MTAPRATMRLQFHRRFTFADAEALVPYFAALGISHIYASPIMTARPGSGHGYDVIDPTRVNPELGGEEGLRRFVDTLRRHQLGLVVDIVPNHMAIGSNNAWWMDVLKHGRRSSYAKYFDIDWQPANAVLHDKVLVPVLGRPYGEALAAGEITLRRIDDGGGFVVGYFEHVFPVAETNAVAIAGLGPAAFDAGSEAGRQRLHSLLEEQHYRLAWWRSANDDINWRRFFDINELAALRVEDDEVFEAVHGKLFALFAEALIDGVRVDHVDGLARPESYCKKLREKLRTLQASRSAATDTDAYLVVEKILARGESLPDTWETDGTTGYDFMDEVSALCHQLDGERPLRNLWQRVSGRPGDFAPEEELARRQILQRSFSAQTDAVAGTFYRIAQDALETRDFSFAAIRRATGEILAHFPVYRIYAQLGHASASDRSFLSQAVAAAKTTCLPSDAWLVDKLGGWLIGEEIRSDAVRLQAVGMTRFQQLSAPLCAKAVEDTAFYRYGRLLSRNDVGFDAKLFSLPAGEFHDKMQARAAALPRSMLATATHDHKRGEDVRARLAVLSELPDDWTHAMTGWLDATEDYCAAGDEGGMPSPGDRAMLFQMIVGAWPLTLTIADRDGLSAFAKRLGAWQSKALREAKLHTDWSAPNKRYEQAADDFIAHVFFESSEMLRDMAAFAARIAPAGAANGLAQTLLKLTLPGVPDIYQGTELWDFSLVDPDNRSAVDFALRQGLLDRGYAGAWRDGAIKQHIIAAALALRKASPQLFAEGDYEALETAGRFGENIVAFARIVQDTAVIVVCCRFAVRLLADDGALSIPAKSWEDTRIVIPRHLHGVYRNVLLPAEKDLCAATETRIADCLQKLPVALFALDER